MPEILADIIVDNSKLKDAISTVLKLAPPYTNAANLTVENNQLTIESRAELSIAIVKVDLESATLSQDKVSFGIDFNQFRIATANRKGNIKLTYTGAVLLISATRYKTELITVDYVQYPAVPVIDAKQLVINKEQSKWLNSIVNTVALKPTAISPIMPISVYIDKESITASCYSRDHIIFIKSDELKGDLEFAVPIETFAAIFSSFGNSEFTLTASDVYLKAENNQYMAYMSLPSTDAYMPTETLLERIKIFSENCNSELSIDYKELSNFFSNCRAVATSERAELIIFSNKDKTVLECKSVLGYVKTSFAGCTGEDINLKVDAEYFQEAISKCDKTLEVTIKCSQEMGYILIPLKNKAYSVIALNS